MTPTPSPTPSSLPFWQTRYGIAAAVATDTIVARSLALYGEWAEHETNLLSGLLEEGQTVLEFGGDFAAHTLWMAQAVGPAGQVHVAEPRRIRFQQLCANVALNRLDNVFTHPVWLGASAGRHVVAPVPATMASRDAGESATTVTIDSLRLDTVHLMKFNLPDALVAALAGAKETIDNHRPLLYARLSGLDQADGEVAAIKALGYRVWSHLPYLFNHDNHAGVQRNIFPGMVQQNAIAAPAGSHFEFDDRLEL